MSVTEKFTDKKICIWGYGREGQSTERFLKELCKPKEVVIFEGKPEELPGGFDYYFKSPGIVLNDDIPGLISQTDVFLEAFRGQTIGITGTKGKSTTSAMLAKVLRDCSGRPTLLMGNIGLPCLDYFAQITEDTLVVFEMSCHQLAHATFAPHISVFLNLFEEHLDYYGTLEAYFCAKSHITSLQEAGDVCYLGENVPAIPSKATQMIVRHNPAKDVELQVFGEHNQLNAQFVRHIAEDCFACESEAVTKSLCDFTGLPHRLQPVGTFEGIAWYDDSISTIPEAAISAVESLPSISTILVGGMDRGISYELLEDYIPKHPELTFVLMYASGKRIAGELTECMGSLPGNILQAEDLWQAVEAARGCTPEGRGCVLSPAAASYGYFKNFEERGEVFAGIVKGMNA